MCVIVYTSQLGWLSYCSVCCVDDIIDTIETVVRHCLCVNRVLLF